MVVHIFAIRRPRRTPGWLVHLTTFAATLVAAAQAAFFISLGLPWDTDKGLAISCALTIGLAALGLLSWGRYRRRQRQASPDEIARPRR